jgi:hypothetical protein
MLKLVEELDETKRTRLELVKRIEAANAAVRKRLLDRFNDGRLRRVLLFLQLSAHEATIREVKASELRVLRALEEEQVRTQTRWPTTPRLLTTNYLCRRAPTRYARRPPRTRRCWRSRTRRC